MVFLRNGIVWILCFLLVMPPQWVLAAEPIVVDTSAAAANQAALATTPSGKAMVNIVKPNSAGVSHNKFTSFNVTSAGIVLNNATGLAETNIAGVIEANPNFSGSAASLILNEVTSSNRSILNGATEIGGHAADYILANPNGITCDGCGFINTPRATLTTGTPVFNAGAVSGLSVNVGDVVIEGLGLDATKADKFAIVTRAARINAQINAQDLGIHTGRQDFDYAARSGTAKVDDGSDKPAFAIDSTALGGMYADRITLVGTEAGLGVRVAGDMAASTGEMVITTNGKLELKSNLSATTDIELVSTASDIEVDQVVYAGGNLTATANAGTVSANADASYGAAGDVTVKADNIAVDRGAQIVAGLDADGALTANGALDLQAATKITAGEGFLGGGASVILKAPTIDLSRTADDNSETVRSRGALKIESGNVTAANGRIVSDGAMALAGNSPIVLGAGRYASATSIALTGDSVTSAATLISDGALDVTSTVGDIVNSGAMTAGTTATLNSAAGISNSGTVESQTGTMVTAVGALTTAAGSKIKSATDTTVTTGGTLTNAGSIYAVQALHLTAPVITNSGSLAGGTDLDINVGSLSNTEGVLHAQNNLTVGGYGGAARATLFNNASGVVETIEGDITIKADTLKNRKSVFTAGSVLASSGYVAEGSCIQQVGDLCIRSHYPFSTPIGTFNINDWTGYSPIGYYYTGAITADSASGLISSGGAITLSGTTISNDKSTLSAVGDINITATTFNNEAAAFYNEAYYSRGGVAFLGREVAGTVDSVVQAGGSLTIVATDPDGVRNGTEQFNNTPPAGAAQASADDFITTPTPSAVLDTAQYADLIPGRDALFVASAAPKSKFLFETRVDFITVQNYYGSDYFVDQLGGVKPEDISTRLGDAYFDTTLVKQTILQETGKRWLDDTIEDDIQQMKALLDGGIQAGKDLQLAFGVALTQAQINALTSDIVWYVEEQYQGRTVLVPKVYLSSATRATLNDRGAILAGDNVTITAATIDNDYSTIKANTDATLTASGDITSTSAKIAAGNNLALMSTDGSVMIETDVMRHNTGGGSVMSFMGQQATVRAGGKLTVAANDNISILGAELTSGGDTDLTAGGDVTIGAVQLRREIDNGVESEKQTVNVASTIDAGGSLSVSSGGSARVKASVLSAAADLSLQATGDVIVDSAQDDFLTQNKNYKLKTITQKSAELKAGGDVTVGSLVGGVSVVASKIDSGGDITLNTPNGTLYLGARKDYREEHISETKSSGFMMTSINRGSIDETVVSTLLTADGNIAIVTADGVIVDYKDTGSLNDSIDQLSQAPGLAWMDDLRGRDDVAWNAVQEAHKSWDYRTQGISPVGAALISLAVSWAVGPAGFVENGVGNSLLGSQITSALGVEAATGTAIANAGFSSLVSQAVTAVVGNGGDIGAALKQLGSMDAIKALATAMVTAGLMESVPMDGLTTSTDSLNQMTAGARKMAEFADKLKVGIAQASISSTVDSVINGAPLGENLKNGLINAAVQVVGAEAAGAIGDVYVDAKGDGVTTAFESALHKVAHAALGCGMAQATGGDCTSGAAGAVAAALVTETFYDANQKSIELANMVQSGDITKAEHLGMMLKWQQEGVDMAALAAGLAAAAAGAETAADINAAANAGSNVAENNYLETAWDVASLALSIAELGLALTDDDSTTLDIALAGGAVVIDGLATVLPFIPAGAGVTLKATKEGGKTVVKATTAAGEDITHALTVANNLPTPVVVSKMPDALMHHASSGVTITKNPDKTTTILGNYKEDMGTIIYELDYPKTLDFGAKKGGYNVLNTPNSLHIDDNQFWVQYNKPFLDRAIERGDDIVLATPPDPDYFRRLDGTQSGFGREYEYLTVDLGYIYDSATNLMRKP